jgi:hypothetical protein
MKEDRLGEQQDVFAADINMRFWGRIRNGPVSGGLGIVGNIFGMPLKWRLILWSSANLTLDWVR